MRRTILPVLLLAAACAATPPPSATAPAAAPPQTTQVASGPSSRQPDPDQIVCRDDVPATGTRIKKNRICLTRAQWSDRARDDRQATSQMQSEGGGAYNLQKSD